MTTKHTPGPWTVGKRVKSKSRINSNTWDGLAKVVTRMRFADSDTPEGLANARLIAAAPDLLSALIGLVRANDDVQNVLCNGPDVPGFDPKELPLAQYRQAEAEQIARQAIAKAGVE